MRSVVELRTPTVTATQAVLNTTPLASAPPPSTRSATAQHTPTTSSAISPPSPIHLTTRLSMSTTFADARPTKAAQLIPFAIHTTPTAAEPRSPRSAPRERPRLSRPKATRPHGPSTPRPASARSRPTPTTPPMPTRIPPMVSRSAQLTPADAGARMHTTSSESLPRWNTPTAKSAHSPMTSFRMRSQHPTQSLSFSSFGTTTGK